MKEPTIIEERGNKTYIQCPRCATPVTYAIHRSFDFEGAQGEMVTEIDAMDDDHSCMTTSCSVCDGTERVKVSHTSPLPVCLRCRGRGFIIWSNWEENINELENVEDELEDLEQTRKERWDDKEHDGLIDKFMDVVFSDVLTEEEKEKWERLRERRQELEGQLPNDLSERYLTVNTCPFCDGTGVDDNDRTDDGGFLVECIRCNGVGRMVVENRQGYREGIREVAECEVCSGEGVVTVYTDPPYRECSNCTKGIVSGRSGFSKMPVNTCEQCDGLGILAEFGVH